MTIINEETEHSQPYLKENGAEVYGIQYGTIEESKFHTGKSYKKIYFIGEFSVDETIDEDAKITDQIVSGKKTLNYQIYVYSNEGPTPHFHIIEKSEKDRNRRFDGCMCIFEAKYFDHGQHVSKMNHKELKILNSFLKMYMNDINTYWEAIVLSWDLANPENKKLYPQNRKSRTQPNYENTNSVVTDPYY